MRTCPKCGTKISEYTESMQKYYQRNKERLNAERTAKRKAKKEKAND